ncbi:MAG TPA: flagellar hook-basal body complex protein FliE [Candidatus Baltobacteraceae bacterium]|jgi:flagellar hook-basal body complex protein FliE|nr:flagellar hook-basal body complex protein FliE [Candidatus Baltobacteraceae bacterium]
MDIDAYSSAISKVTPGSFVPDVAPGGPASQLLPDDQTGAGAVSFKDTVKSLLEDVNDKMVNASQMSQDLAAGKSRDFDGTIKSVEEASLAFQFTMAIRNKLMDAYSEIQQMQF